MTHDIFHKIVCARVLSKDIALEYLQWYEYGGVYFSNGNTARAKASGMPNCGAEQRFVFLQKVLRVLGVTGWRCRCYQIGLEYGHNETPCIICITRKYLENEAMEDVNDKTKV